MILMCDFPPCKKKDYGKAENLSHIIVSLCKEHYEVALMTAFKDHGRC